MSDDQAAVRALPPTDLFSVPSSLEHPATVRIVSATALKGSLKQPLDDYVYPDQRPPRYPLERDRYVIVCVDPRGEFYLASRVAFARHEDAERLAAMYSSSRTPAIRAWCLQTTRGAEHRQLKRQRIASLRVSTFFDGVLVT